MSTMKGIAVSISSQFFLDMMAMEVPYLTDAHTDSTFSQKNALSFAMHLLTNINPKDPKSLLAGEVPGMRSESTTLLYSAKATKTTDSPADYTPPAEVFKPEVSAPSSQIPEGGEPAAGAEKDPNADAGNPAGNSADNSNGQAPDGGKTVAPAERKKAVFIYHSHNRESFLSELKDRGINSPDLAFDAKTNITLVGKRLSEKIEQLGIGTVHSNVDYPSSVQSFNYAKSYAYSSKTVKEVLAAHRDVRLVFDVHRDSLQRDRTTVRINGKDYAQIYFVVGKRNPNWEENSDFANTIHTKLEESYSGISRGVFGKSSHGNAEYNQSLSPNSILMEIGGPYNTLEEMYRTADLLAGIIAEIYWEAEKVSAPAR
jgi:stage II sporulation protein P